MRAHHIYTTLDEFPMHHWNKVTETGDLSWLLRDRKSIVFRKKQLQQLRGRWEVLNDEYIKLFGLGESLSRIIIKEREIARMKVEMWAEGDKTQQTFIRIAEDDLAEIKSRLNDSQDFYKSKAWLDKRVGFAIPLKETSVREYYNMLFNEIEQVQQEIKQHGNRE